MTNFIFNFGDILATLLIFMVVVVIPAGGLSALLHFVFSLPMRRRDRARFFLDLLETALDRGQSVEQAILSAAGSRDDIMGVQFYLVAAHIEDGRRLGEALQKVPRFLPSNISMILRAGEKLGDLKKVLPACRENLRSPSDIIQSLIHYMVLVLMLVTPICAWVIWIVSVFVIPKFKDVAAGMGVKLWPLSYFVFHFTSQIILFEALVSLLLFFMMIMYAGGPGFIGWFRFYNFPFVDWIAWHIPWKRKRLQRTFSAMLAVLLDGGVPEVEAVRLAGEATANEICRRRTARVISAMEQGTKLDEAVRIFDGSGEFHWRLTNATHGSGGFLSALHGWHESLDAKAIQQESVAAQIATSGLVIMNGLIVALIAIGMFGILVAILRGVLNTQ